MNEYRLITRLLVKHARDAFRSQADCDREWRTLNFTAAPDLRRARADYDAFLKLLSSEGAQLELLPADRRVSLGRP